MVSTGALAHRPWQPVSTISTLFWRDCFSISDLKALQTSSAPSALQPVVQMNIRTISGRCLDSRDFLYFLRSSGFFNFSTLILLNILIALENGLCFFDG